MLNSWITTNGQPIDNEPVSPDRLPPVHPGEMLREEFLVPLGLTPYAVAKAIGVPRTRIERLVRGETGLTADTALRLARFFRMTPEFWMGLQCGYELETAWRANVDVLKAIAPLPRPDLDAPDNAAETDQPPLAAE